MPESTAAAFLASQPGELLAKHQCAPPKQELLVTLTDGRRLTCQCVCVSMSNIALLERMWHTRQRCIDALDADWQQRVSYSASGGASTYSV